MKSLTSSSEIDNILYLLKLSEAERNLKMKGVVRPISREVRCPTCKKPFKLYDKIGFICRKCKTVPQKFRIDIHWKRERLGICSDKQGQALDSYQRAVNLHSLINQEIQDRTFDPSKFVRSKVEEFWVKNLINKFHEEKKKVIAPSNILSYKKHIERHRDFWRKTDVREIRRIDLRQYVEWLEQTQGIKPKTIKNTLDNFKTFMNWCKNELEIITSVPSFPDIDIPEFKHTWFESDEQVDILELVDPGDRPIIAFLMLHGCRPGEARALKVKDVDFKKGKITIQSTFSDKVLRDKRKGKKSKPVEIPIHPEMYNYFKERVVSALPGVFIFMNPRNGKHYTKSSFRRVWDKVRAKGNLPQKIRCYDATRHLFGSILANRGESIYKISKLMGHSSIKMTEKYTHSDVNSLRNTLSKVSLKKEAKVVRITSNR
jgi:integrase